MFDLRNLGSGRSEDTFRRMRIHPIWRSDVCLSACICEGLTLLVSLFDVLLLGPAFCSSLVVSVRVRMFDLRTLGSGRFEGASGRT